MPLPYLISAALLWGAAPAPAPREKYEAYIREAEARIQREVKSEPFLWAAQSPARWARVRAGETVVEPFHREGTVDIGRALVHDWIGAAFIPGVKLEQVVSFLQDYAVHKTYYRPEVADSRLVSHDGNEFHLFYRIVKKKLMTIVVNSDHVASYFPISPTRLHSRSYTTRIAEVQHAGKPNEREVPPEQDPGVFWKLNTYWRLEEKDGGVYVESQSISLTCPIPLGLGWLITPLIRSTPGESLAQLLTATRNAVLSRARRG